MTRHKGLLIGGGLVAVTAAWIAVYLGYDWYLRWDTIAAGKVIITSNNLSRIQRYILGFHNVHGRHPRDLEEMRQFRWRDGGGEAPRDLFLDGWGRPLQYVVHAPRLNKGHYDLYSLGLNGVDEYDRQDFGDDLHLLANGAVRRPPAK